MVDHEVRAKFYEGATTSVLKCLSSFNHHTKRHDLINKECNNNKCPWYLEEEDWEHVLLHVANEEAHEEFLFWLWERLIKSESANRVSYEIL